MFCRIAVYSLCMILCYCNPIQPEQNESENTDSVENDAVNNKWWNEASRALGVVVGDCWSIATRALQDDVRKQQKQQQVAVLINCLQHRTRGALTTALSSDVIPLTEGVELVRYQARNDTGNIRGVRMKDEKYEQNTSISGGWRSLLIDSISDVFETHAIRITIRDLQATQHEMEARRRRRRNHMLPLMMFGLVGLGIILIPMGFQFLAVLGGKALLLAKMALILTSIQGLKKVATSNINYGLYQSSPENPWYDRKAEDIERPYKMDEVYYNQYPEHIVEYKRYPRV